MSGHLPCKVDNLEFVSIGLILFVYVHGLVQLTTENVLRNCYVSREFLINDLWNRRGSFKGFSLVLNNCTFILSTSRGCLLLITMSGWSPTPMTRDGRFLETSGLTSTAITVEMSTLRTSVGRYHLSPTRTLQFQLCKSMFVISSDVNQNEEKGAGG